MISWKSIAPVAVAVGLMFSAQAAQAFSIPVPSVQEDVGRTDINLVPADKLLLLNQVRSTGRVAYGGLSAVYLPEDGEFFVNFSYESTWLLLGAVMVAP